MEVAFVDHDLSEGAAVWIGGMGERIKYALEIRRGAVLAELEFAFEAGDGNLERDDAAHHFFAVVVGEISGPGLFE